MNDPKIKTISFDIFDTLLVRPCIHPKDIYYLIDRKAKELYNVDFIDLRWSAGQELNNPNATIFDVWDYIRKKNKLSKSLMNQLIELEIDCESNLLTARKIGKELYEYAVLTGKRIIAISDMYLPRKVLQDILIKNGFTKLSQVYISCDCSARKDSGELYDYVLQKENIKKQFTVSYWR